MGDIAEQMINDEMFGGGSDYFPSKRLKSNFKWWQAGNGQPRIRLQDMSIQQLEDGLRWIEDKQLKFQWQGPLNKQLRYVKRKLKT
jgi:hypothetical protein